MSSCNNFGKPHHCPNNRPCPPIDKDYPTQTNFAVVNVTDQTVGSLETFIIDGSKYENGINILDENTLMFYRNGFYSIEFIVTVAATQSGPLDIGFVVNNGIYANGVVNSTNTGLQLTGIGFVEIRNAPVTGQLKNFGDQPIDVDFLRLTVIKIS